MKFIWIILFFVISIVDISLSKVDEDSLETEVNKNDITNTTTSITEKYRQEIIRNKQKKFVVTLKPPINYHHKKSTRIKKKYVKSKEAISKHTKKPSHFPSKLKYSKVSKRKYDLKNQTNESLRKMFQDKIMKIDISLEDESKETTSIVCKGIDIKKLKGEWHSIKRKNKKYSLQDISKLRKCLSKLKKIKASLPLSSKRKNENFKNIIHDEVIFNALRQLLKEEHNKSDNNNINVKSSEEKDREKFSLATKKPVKSKLNVEADDDKARNNFRTKRSVIEEERVPTSSTGFKYTGRDLSMSHQYTYKNINF